METINNRRWIMAGRQWSNIYRIFGEGVLDLQRISLATGVQSERGCAGFTGNYGYGVTDMPAAIR